MNAILILQPTVALCTVQFMESTQQLHVSAPQGVFWNKTTQSQDANPA